MSVAWRGLAIVIRPITRFKYLRWSIRFRLVDSFSKKAEFSFKIKYYCFTYLGNFNNFIERRMYMFGAHEKEYLDYVLKFINRDSIVLDIGANYGNHSLGFAQKAQKVFAFEPDPWAYSKLKKIIQKNEIDNIYAFNFGLGESNENRLFYTANSNFNRGQSSFKNVLGTDLTPITSRVMPGDKFIKNHNILKIDFIKIDTEGYEYEVLKGLKSSIERFSPLILLEYNKEHLSELNEFLYHHKIYKPFLISINRSRFIFNQPHGIETTFNTNINRGEVLLIPRDLVCK